MQRTEYTQRPHNNTGESDKESVTTESMEVSYPEQGPDHDELLERMKAGGSVKFQLDDAAFLQDTKYSSHIWVRSLPWRLMVMPRPSQSPRKSLGVFMQCCVQEINADVPVGWSCLAIVTFKAYNHLEGKEYREKKVDHTYDAKENDWGFPSFLSWDEVINANSGFVKDGSISLEAHVLAEAPHGIDWDSKRFTGCVGLKNQGATCYMNSLLQTLFFTNQLRKAVYQMPTETDDSVKSVPLAMQRVFYELQFSDRAVATKKLTRSFGWDTWDSFMQHDVQELSRVLLDNLENKMKGTQVQGTIPKLFEGKMESYVKCKNVDYKSSRTEAFMDIQLNIKGKKNLYESFDDYICVESLDGDNKYDAGDHGLQDAEKGVVFTKFPPVLHLQLMRFQFDPLTEANVKINDRYEFPEKLDVTKYLKDGEEATPICYTLHAVLVHSGDNYGGHYVAYLNPEGNGQWLKFDDDVVSLCSNDDAVENNFGGPKPDQLPSRSCTNAYMLVYIKDSCMQEILARVSDLDIPSSLKERFAKEKHQEEQRRKERREAHLYVSIEVYTSDSFHGHRGHDLIDFLSAKPLSFRFLKTMAAEEVENAIADNMGYGSGQLRMWPIQQRENNTLRPACIVSEERKNPISDFSGGSGKIRMFVEVLKPDTGADQLPEFTVNDDCMLFFKFYDPPTKTLSYVTHFPVPVKTKFSELVPVLSSHVGLPINTPLQLFEEVQPDLVEPIDLSKEIRQVEDLQDGDIVCFQKVDASYASLLLPTVGDYFSELASLVSVCFYDVLDQSDPGLKLELSYRLNYVQIAKHVASQLDVDPLMIQFFKPHPTRQGVPGQSVKCSFGGTLKDLLIITTRWNIPRVLYYQRIPMRIDEYETKKQLHCTFFSSNLKEMTEIIVFVNEDGTVQDVLMDAEKQLAAQGGGSRRLRLLDIVNSKIYSVYPQDAHVDTIPQKVLRLEEVLPEDLDLDDNKLLVPVAHFQKEPIQTFGVPFFFVVKEGELVSSLRHRICKKLEIGEKEFEKYKLALVHSGRAHFYPESEDVTISLDDFRPPPRSHVAGFGNHALHAATPWLGLEHVNRTPKRQRVFLEKAIKIFN
ncbi:ubiquitin carboxyl-terminal hydrolase 7-like isoform X2 [Corticium candelabrum]|uniref:ubiquitin carboxyl-terminal hydrolase 7-like isoform X2 n=1 Tax=Corticium candelabrum TaxID=121492 RepID=UPI002E36F4D8|nr:ubiquitin carboxyl-terminal hydrolase 7-like isoform X2 [Corticium candelabrum]